MFLSVLDRKLGKWSCDCSVTPLLWYKHRFVSALKDSSSLAHSHIT